VIEPFGLDGPVERWRRVRGTVEAIEREIVADGLVQRYSCATDVDSLPPGEGAFLPCSFWLADNLALIGRLQEAEALFEGLQTKNVDWGAYELFQTVSRRTGKPRPAQGLRPAVCGQAREENIRAAEDRESPTADG
jgi:hypothetical protein